MVRTFLWLAVAACGFAPTPSGTGTDALALDAADLCSPATTGCDGRVRRTCGADHHWDPAQDQTCDFTCSMGACVLPSNIPIAEVATCASTAPPLAPPAGAQITLTASNGTHISCNPDCGTPGVSSIAPIATHGSNPGYTWFCLSKLVLPAGTTLGLPATGGPKEAIAFVVDGTVDIAGTITFDGGSPTSALAGGVGAPGGFDGADRSGGTGIDGHGPCPGKGGGHDGSSNHWIGGGGGGGGGQTAGATGGNGRCTVGDHNASGSVGGSTCGVSTLVPLVGGSGGGSGGDATTGVEQGWAGGGGGGALQIASRLSISIAGSGAISARGGTGYGVPGTAGIDGGGGGGAGGAILLEAPHFMITGGIVVDGGDGGVAGSGAGGTGATATAAPTAGLSFTMNGQGGTGGGGAGGRVRVNGGNSSCSSAMSPLASCTAGTLATQ